MRRCSLAPQFSSQVGQVAKPLSAVFQAASDSLLPVLVLSYLLSPLCSEGNAFHTGGVAVEVHVLRVCDALE